MDGDSDTRIESITAITKDYTRTLSFFLAATMAGSASVFMDVDSMTIEEWRWRLTLIAQLSITISSFLLVILAFYHEKTNKQFMKLEELVSSRESYSAHKSRYLLGDLLSTQKITFLVNVVTISLLLVTLVSVGELVYNYQGVAITSLVTNWIDKTILGLASGLFLGSVTILLYAMYLHVKRLSQHEAILIDMEGVVRIRNEIAHGKDGNP